MNKCSICGIESRPGVDLHIDRRFGRKPRTYCQPCWDEQARKVFGRRSLFELLAAMAILTVYFGPGTAMRAATMFLWAAVAFVLSIVIHELGHALAAWVLGLRVFRICIGSGKPLLSASIGALALEWRALPLSGLTMVAPTSTHGLYPKQAFVLFCGPLFNVLAAGLPFLLLPAYRVLQTPFLAVMVFFNGLAFLFALIPRRVKTLQGIAISDGLALFQLKSQPQFRPENALAARYSSEAERLRQLGRCDEARTWLEKGSLLFPGNAIIADSNALIMMDEGRYEDARDLLTRVLSDECLEPILRPGIANNLAWTNILCGRPELMEEVISLAEEAYQASPLMPSVMGTQGLALVLKGEIVDGLNLLSRALRLESRPRERASIACSMAYGERLRGYDGRSRRFLEQAQRLNPQCPLCAVLLPGQTDEAAASLSQPNP